MDVSGAATLHFDEPSWLHDGNAEERVSLREAAEFLAELDDEDFGVFVLAYGLGMRFGAISQTLKLDPALVAWRLRRTLDRWRRGASRDGASARALENALVKLLRDPEGPDLPTPPRDSKSWRVGDLMHDLEEGTRTRLAAQLRPRGKEERVRPGVGVGLAAIVLLAAAALMFFGVVSDDHPMHRGRELIAEGRYDDARASFMRLGVSPRARKYRALCYIAEGNFADAFGLFQSIDVLDSMGQFAPRERTLSPKTGLGAGGALLPRGPLLAPKPKFSLAEPRALDLRVSLNGVSRSFSTAGADGEPRSRFKLPDTWGTLPSGKIRWSLLDGSDSWAEFEILPFDTQQEILLHIKRRLPSEFRNTPVVHFLKAQLFLNMGLLAEAGEQLALLAEEFPDEVYPASRLADVATALGVDPSAFLR